MNMRLLLVVALAAGCYPDPDKIQPADSDAAPAVDSASNYPTPDVPAAPDEPAPVDLSPLDSSVAVDATLDASPLDSTPAQGGIPVPAGLTNLSPAADRCNYRARTFCARFQECSPSWFNVQYLDIAVCENAESVACQLVAELPGSTFPNVECARSYADFSCAMISGGKQPAQCYAAGNNLEGQGCIDEHQCQGRRCVFQDNEPCGKCARRGTYGEACAVSEDCHRDLFCYKNRCTFSSEPGQSCSSSPCQPGFRCGADGLCDSLSTEGEACTVGKDCDVYAGFTCGTKLNKCVRYAPSATTCGQNPDGSFTFCAGSRACSAGACKPNAKEGEACSDDTGPYCEWPAYCDSSTLKCKMPVLDGTCGVPAPISGPPTNIAAEISGAEVGYPEDNNEDYRKKLQVTVLDPKPTNLTVGPVWGLGSKGSNNMYLPVPVTYSGSDIACSVRASAINVLDTAGATLRTLSGPVIGSMQQVGTTWNKYCLRPGETGYVLTIATGNAQTNVFANADSLQIAFDGFYAGAENVVRVTPIAYSTQLTESWASLLVTVKNTGTLYATLGDSGYYLLLDDIGPVALGQLLVSSSGSGPSPTKTLAPGDSGTLTTPDSGGITRGHGNRVRVFLDLKQP